MDNFDGGVYISYYFKMLHCSLLKLEQLERYIVHVSLICEPVSLGVFIYPYMHVYTRMFWITFMCTTNDGLYCTGLLQLQLCSWFNAEDVVYSLELTTCTCMCAYTIHL